MYDVQSRRKNRKKMLAGFLAGLTLTGAAAGCSAPAEEENAESRICLNVTWWGNEVRDSRTQRVLKLYQDENDGILIEGKSYPVSDYWDRMEVHAAGKTMPDLLQMGYNELNSYAGKELLLDLTPYIEDGTLDVSDIPQNVLDLGKSGDGVYGIASGINAQCLFYNKTVTDECGITMKDNMTLDEFIEIARIVAEQTGYRANLCPIDGDIFVTLWSRAEGIQITGPEVPVADADAYVPFFRILEQGIEEGWHLRPDYGDMTAIETDPLVYGSIPRTMAWCTVHGGSNLLSAFQAAAPKGTEIGITTVPTSHPEKSNFLNPSMFFSVSADTEHPEEAVKLINYLINSEEANNILLGERGMPASSVIAEKIIEKLPRAERRAMEFLEEAIIPCSSEIDPPGPEGMIELVSTLEEILGKVSSGECTAEEAAELYYAEEVRLWGE